jgi:hypothetical protein
VALKILHRGPLEWRYLHTKFHEILPSISEVTSGGHRQTGDLISLHSFFESRLRMSRRQWVVLQLGGWAGG